MLETRRPPLELPHALSQVKIRGTPHMPLVFFLDYDGTLSPIVNDPDSAFLPDATRSTLAHLANRYTTAIVSGRSLNKLRNFVKLESLYYAASHGFDILGPDGQKRHQLVEGQFVPDLKSAAHEISGAIEHIPGAFVEDNWFAVSVHHRRCDERDIPQIEAIIDGVLNRFPSIRKCTGRRVFELRPRLEWDKGKAVDWILHALELEGACVPIYIGDDRTDEDAFRAVKKHHGISIIVADGNENVSQTHADYLLRDPSEVEAFLDGFLEPQDI
mmetsp:Transcript_3598/g.6828  ORF Transcript_3598/g.6828 Transcript_3598/m.6828 type:complete len:272 (+) Transcript_3598:121-936(+)